MSTASTDNVLDGGAGDQSQQDSVTLPADDWRQQIDEDIRSEPSLADIGNINDLAKRMIHSQRMVGADKVVLPGKDATDEDIAEFYTKLGRPESADKYELPQDNMPENWEPDQTRIDAMSAEAHRLGLTAQQFAGLVRADATFQSEFMEQHQAGQEQSREQAEGAMRREYGKAYDQNIKMAQGVIQQFLGEEADNVLQKLNETGMGNDPYLIRLLVNVGKAISQDEVIGGGGTRQYTPSPGDAKAEIDKLNGDSEFREAYTGKRHPGHAAAQQKMAELHELAYPEEAT